MQFQNALIFRAFSDMLSPVSRGTSTHFLRFVQRGECEWSAILRVTSGTHKFSSNHRSKWLEIMMPLEGRGFESLRLRQRNPHKPSVYAGFYTYIAVTKKYASSILGSKSRCKLHILLPNGISAFLNCQKMRGRQKADSAKAKLPYFLP